MSYESELLSMDYRAIDRADYIDVGRKADKDIEAKDKLIARMRAVLTETQELLKGGSKGSSSIVDTVWCNSMPNTTLYELIELTKGEKDV